MPPNSAPANERIPVLVTRAEKARISKAAEAQGISMGEYLRRAADAFDPEEDVAALEALVAQVRKSTARANEALGNALGEIEASEARIEAEEMAARKAWQEEEMQLSQQGMGLRGS